MPVKTHCLPFSEIPHTTALFRDFLARADKTLQFYPRSPRFADWFREAAKNLVYAPERRAQVAGILQRQNVVWSSFAETTRNIERFRSGACAVVTGQQVGLFGGPLFTILKALTAVKFAQQATDAGVDCVPIFWLANEDHDLDEVNHVSIPAQDFHLERVSAPTTGAANAQVGSIAFGQEIVAAVDEASRLLGESEATNWLRETYRPGQTFGSAFASLFAKVFAESGVILLDGSDPGLRAIARPIFTAAIERAAELDDLLLHRGKELEAAGYHQQVKVTPDSTLLFAIQNGARLPIRGRASGEPNEAFAIGHEKLSSKELLRRIDRSPGDFSPNVLLRPIMQDYLLPTIAYAGGPAEVAYFAQTGVVYEALLGKITPVIPRFSATMIEAKPDSLLEKHHLRLSDLFAGPTSVRERLGALSLPADVQSALSQAALTLDKTVNEISAALRQLDPTLVAAAATAGSKMRHQITRLSGKAARAQLRREEVLARHGDLLSSALYPDNELQERATAAIYFLACYPDLIDRLTAALQTDCLDHQLLHLAA